MLSKISKMRTAFILSACLMQATLTTSSWGMEAEAEDAYTYFRSEIVVSTLEEYQSLKKISELQSTRSLAIQSETDHMDKDTSFSFKTLFQFHPHLEMLEINHFSMGCSAYGSARMTELCSVLEQNTTLKILCLTYCNIYNEEATPLAKAIFKNSTLEMLDIRSNHIRNLPWDMCSNDFESTLKTKSNFKLVGLDKQQQFSSRRALYDPW